MRFNLLPQEYRPQPPLKFRRVLLLTGVCVFLIGAIVFSVLNYLTLQRLEERCDTLERQIAVYDFAIAEIEGIEAFIEKVRRWEAEVEKIGGFYQPNQPILWTLAASLPEESWLMEVEISLGRKLLIKGNTLSLGAMGSFLQNLNNLSFFQTSFLKEVQEIKSDEVSFYQFQVEIEAGRSEQ